MKPLFFALALGVTACSGGSSCPEPFYDGKGTDEAWRTMQDGQARATKNDAKAVTVFFPAAGEKISSATAPTFTWSTPLTASNLRLPPRSPSILSRAGELLYSTAWAHLPPVTGPVHLLRMTVPGRACAIELVTTRVEWIPNAEAWTQLKATAGKTVTFEVFSAYMQETRITEGPFHFTTPLTFSVAP
jgi:hypothetical protein